MEWKRGSIRPRDIMLDSLEFWHGGTSVPEIIRSPRDRRLWPELLTGATGRGQKEVS